MDRSLKLVKILTAVALVVFAAAVVPARSQTTTASPDATATPQREFDRWVEFETINLSTRYRALTSSNDVTTHQNQYQVAVRGRFKIDRKGRYSVNAGLFSGDSLTSGWNSTGIGPSEIQGDLFVKQLYLKAEPVKGVELQFGGIAVNNGVNTEITGYDNDIYLTGERVTLRRPKDLYFDEVSITYAYLGDVNRPSVFHRFRNLDKSNYHQYLVRKRFSKRVDFSADYTFEFGRDILHEAVRVKVPESRVLDTALFESYQRVSPDDGFGFNIYGEKAITKKFSLNGGFARIDAPMLNTDRFPPGKRLYLGGAYKLTKGFTITGMVIQKVGQLPPQQTLRRRGEIILSYDLLETLRRFKVL